MDKKVKTVRARKKEDRKLDPQLKPPFPKKMLIELTNHCDHKCIFCMHRKMTRKKRFIEKDLLYRIMQEAFELGVEELGLYIMGEPFLVPELPEYIAKAKEIGFPYVYLGTNGAAATPDRAKAVIDAGLDSIKYSINAGTKETYELVHGKDHFQLVMDNLKYMVQYRKKSGKKFLIYASCVLTTQNHSEHLILRELLKDQVDDLVFYKVTGQTMMNEIQGLVHTTEPQTMEPPCPNLFNRLNVTAEGYLSACSGDPQNYLVMADLHETTLREGWHNDQMVNLRKRHLENDLEGTMCYNCMHDKTEPITPINPGYETPFTWDAFNLKEEINGRIAKWKKAIAERDKK